MMPPAALWGQVQMAMQQGRLDAAEAGANQILRAAPCGVLGLGLPIAPGSGLFGAVARAMEMTAIDLCH